MHLGVGASLKGLQSAIGGPRRMLAVKSQQAAFKLLGELQRACTPEKRVDLVPYTYAYTAITIHSGQRA